MGLGVFCSSTCMDVFCNTVLPWHQPWVPPAILGNPCAVLGSRALGAAAVAGPPEGVVPASHAGHFLGRWQEMVTGGVFFTHFVGNQAINTARGVKSHCLRLPSHSHSSGLVNHELLASLSTLGQPAHLHSPSGFPTSQLVSRRGSATQDLHRVGLEFT